MAGVHQRSGRGLRPVLILPRLVPGPTARGSLPGEVGSQAGSDLPGSREARASLVGVQRAKPSGGVWGRAPAQAPTTKRGMYIGGIFSACLYDEPMGASVLFLQLLRVDLGVLLRVGDPETVGEPGLFGRAGAADLWLWGDYDFAGCYSDDVGSL